MFGFRSRALMITYQEKCWRRVLLAPPETVNASVRTRNNIFLLRDIEPR